MRNFGGDALKKTRDAAVSLVNARYARRPTQSYFAGGSTGGREALAAIRKDGQRHEFEYALELPGGVRQFSASMSQLSRSDGAPESSIAIRSKPNAMPPCGGAPNWNARYMPPN